MDKNKINRLFFAELAILILSSLVLWVLNNHFLQTTKANQVALVTVAAANAGLLLYVSYISIRKRLAIQGSVSVLLLLGVIGGTAFLYQIFNVGSAVGNALQNANFTF